MTARVSQEGLLVVDVGAPGARVSQEGVLVVDVGSPKGRVSQEGVLVVDVGSPKARVSQEGLLVVYPSPPYDPVPWLPRLALAAPAAASPFPAAAWSAALAAARPSPDLLPWLPRVAVASGPGAATPGAASWSAALAPAPDPSLPWLSRAAAAPPPAATRPHEPGWSAALSPAPDAVPWLGGPAPGAAAGRPPAPGLAAGGWRPELAATFAPAVRHALVRFWRGPQAHMPRLEDGEPAWATDTKSLWVGSPSGNVRIGP